MSTGEPLDLDALADDALATHGGFGDNWKIRTIKAVREQSRSWTLREIGQAVDRAVDRRDRAGLLSEVVERLREQVKNVDTIGVALAEENRALRAERDRLRNELGYQIEAARQLSLEVEEHRRTIRDISAKRYEAGES
jgi:hypothetical protein